MQEQLKELNKLLKKDLIGSRKSKNFKGVFKNFIFIFASTLIIVLFISLAPFADQFLKREIIISAQGQTMGLVFSSLEQKQRVNLLILGIPGKGYYGENMTDTIILINSTLNGKNPIGFSLPRDLLVKFPEKNYHTKINAIFNSSPDKKRGIELIKSTIKEVTGINVDYFIVFDLNSVKKFIDELGGIDVVLEKDLYDPKFPAANDGYETFFLPKGIHHLDGETTLKYLRSRYAPDGDFSRIKRQQEVINILKNKILSLNLFWDFPKVLRLWKAFSESIYTNVDIVDIKYIWNLIGKTNPDMVEFNTIDTGKNQLLISKEIMLNGEPAYILEPQAGIDNYEKIKEYINNLIKTQTEK